MPIIAKNLSHIYSAGTPFETAALQGADFVIEDGSFTGIIGHTGSGKSTLVQHLNALLQPTGGELYVQGMDLRDKKLDKLALRRKVGLVFQYPEYQLFEETVAKDVAFGPHNLGLTEEETEARVRAAMEDVGLPYEQYADTSPFDLSGGKKRRAAIAGVLAMQPEILVLDEPTAGLDPMGRREILGRIEHLRVSRALTVIMVSHSMDEVAAYADNIIVMENGRVAMQGTPKEIFSRFDELENMGLGLPEAGRLIAELNRRGFSLPQGEYDADAVADMIADALGKGAAL